MEKACNERKIKNIIKLKTYSEIKKVINEGEKCVLPYFIIYRTKNPAISSSVLLGILLSRKFGKAVKRNYARRRIIALLNQYKDIISKNYIYVFIPRWSLIKKEYHKIQSETEKFFKNNS